MNVVHVDLRALLLQSLSFQFSSGIISTVHDFFANIPPEGSGFPFISGNDVSLFDVARSLNSTQQVFSDSDLRMTLYDYVRLLQMSHFLMPTSTQGFLVYLSFSPFVSRNVIPKINFPDIDPILSRALDRATDEIVERIFSDFGVPLPTDLAGIPKDQARNLLDAFLDFGVTRYVEKLKSEDYVRSLKDTMLSILFSLAVRTVGGDMVSMEFDSYEIPRIGSSVVTIPKKYSFPASVSVSLTDYVVIHDGGKEYIWSGFMDLFSSYIQFLMFNDSFETSSSIPLKFKGLDVGSITSVAESLSVQSVFALSASSALSVVKIHTAPYHISSFLVVPSSVEEPSFSSSTAEIRRITVKFSPIWRMGIRVNSVRDRNILRIANQVFKASTELARTVLGG